MMGRIAGVLCSIAVVAAVAATVAPAATASSSASSSATGGIVYGQQPASTPATLADAARRLGQQRLARGARGDQVRVLQMWLNDIGYAVTVNGHYNRATQRAVRRFQSDHGLSADGVAGRTTISTLRGARSARQAAVGTESWVFPIRPLSRVAPISYWSTDQGIDIPPFAGYCGKQVILVAVADGTIVEEGIPGFGSQSPILKIASGRYAGRYVYYGHSQPALVKVGAHVTAGQPIAQMGCGIVGQSETPHLEIGISSRGGPPCCPGFGETAPLVQAIMLDLYHRAKSGS